GQRIRGNAEIEKYYSYLSELSYFLNEKKSIEIDEYHFMVFHKFFIEKYRVQLSFRDAISILEDCNIIQKHIESYKFKYKYIYFYFIGKYLSDNIESEDIQKKVSELSNNLYQTESANIYIFLSHHSKSKFVINQIILKSKELFENEDIIGFNSDVDSINSLIQETTEKIYLEDSDPSTENTREIGIEDKKEKIPLNEDEYEVDENIDSISKINKAFKTIEILGYIIKNR